MRRVRWALPWLVAAVGAAALCAQFKRFGAWEVHYIAFNASELSADIAERYAIVRGPNKGLVNVSAVRGEGGGRRVRVEGAFTDLLGQSHPLTFREIVDAETFYYLAAFDFPHAEALRFEIAVTLPEHGLETVRFQQPLYRTDR